MGERSLTTKGFEVNSIVAGRQLLLLSALLDMPEVMQ